MSKSGTAKRRPIVQDRTLRLYAALCEMINENGLQHFCFGVFPEDANRAFIGNTMLSNWPAEILNHYKRSDIAEGRAMLDILRDTVLPVTFTTVIVKKTDVDLHSADNLSHTIGLTLHDRLGRRYFLLLSAGHIALSRDRLASIVFDSLSALDDFSVDVSPQSQLSSREVECLKWTAAGKSSPEIAVICGLSAHTVTGHLKSALKKLDCVTRAHAVAKATRLHII